MPTPNTLRVYPSHKQLLRDIRHFLPDFHTSKRIKHADAIIGWGLKPYGRMAKYVAQACKKPYISLEDGFLRSVGLGKQNAAPLSLIVDYSGVYYDASAPSDLEHMLNHVIDETCRKRGAEFIDYIRRTGLTKYNIDTQATPERMRDGGRHILLIDQTHGDASLRYGTDNAQHAFDQMLRVAYEEFPDATLWIKAHPDVIHKHSKSGIKKALRSFPEIQPRWITDSVSVGELSRYCEHVLTVTSQAGLEALIAGSSVHCFGRPFYAGWGLTRDYGIDVGGASDRRRKDVPLDALVYNALIAYPRYCDPFTRRLISAEEAADILCYIRHCYTLRPASLHCIGFSGWKYAFTQRCLGTPATRVKFYKHAKHAIKAADKDGGALAVWASKEKGALAYALASRPVDMPLYRIEDAFLRSVGLGSALLPACSLAIDSTGIYYNGSQPSDMEMMLETAHLSASQCAQGKYLADVIVSRNISKYQHANQGDVFTPPPGNRKNIHLVVGQVEDDASVQSAPPEAIRSNAGLLRHVRETFPDALLLYRPHPDVTAGYRKGTVFEDTLEDTGAMLVRDYALSGLLRAADHVHTISSLAGFEALCYGKRVHTYGAPFYAGWGLTRDRVHFERRTRIRSPEELIYIAFEMYPLYADPVSGYPCGAEMIIDRLSDRALMLDIETPGFSDRNRLLRYMKGMRVFED